MHKMLSDLKSGEFFDWGDKCMMVQVDTVRNQFVILRWMTKEPVIQYWNDNATVEVLKGKLVYY